jgi:sporulation protein YlmC with PRC-barrel domain
VNPAGSLKLVSQVRDLQIVDRDGRKCGIADDLEFEGKPGGPMKLKAILVGPDAFGKRLPRWTAWLALRIGGRHVVRVPWSKVRSIGSTIELDSTAGELGLGAAEGRAARWLPRGGAY